METAIDIFLAIASLLTIVIIFFRPKNALNKKEFGAILALLLILVISIVRLIPICRATSWCQPIVDFILPQ